MLNWLRGIKTAFMEEWERASAEQIKKSEQQRRKPPVSFSVTPPSRPSEAFAKHEASGERDTFYKHFRRVAGAVGIPEELHKAFRKELFEARNNPQEAQGVCEKYFAQLKFEWPAGLAELKADGKRGTPKQLCMLFFRKVAGPARNETHKNTILALSEDLHPFIEIDGGNSENKCPIHGEHLGRRLKKTDPIFETEFGLHPDCSCRMRPITKFQLENK